MRARGARGAIVAVVALVVASLAGAPGGAQPLPPPTLTPSATGHAVTGTVTADKAGSGRLVETDAALLARDDAAPVAVMIKLDHVALASYRGGIAGLAPTSPSVTGARLTGAAPAEQAYVAHVAERERGIVSAITIAVPEIRIGRSFRIVYGGVSAVLPADRVEDVLAVEGVVAVQEDAVRQPHTGTSPGFIGAPAVYRELGATADAGEGIVYGNLDTGVWPEHPSFADLGHLAPPPPRPDGAPRDCDYGDDPTTAEVDPFVCGAKLIGGAHLTDTYDVVFGDDPFAGTARDGDGHGTHTASTTAGNIVDAAVVLGVDRGGVHGVAPGAHVMAYKVCGLQGCIESDSAAAVEQAILDGVDVINFSVGGGSEPYADPVELAFLDAYAAGIFVAASAGNDGPGAGTANHLGPWVTTVAASTQVREFATTLTLTAGDGATFTADGATITAGAGPLPVVLAADVPGYDDPLCGAPPPTPTTFDGLIVGCERGGQARVWKGFNVARGGGEGMVLSNPSLQDVETDNHWLPTVHLPDGTAFVDFMERHAGVTGSFAAGEARPGQGDVMAAFSSRGPGGDVLKPDVTAPGVQILAGASPAPPTPTPDDGGSPPGQLFQAIAGTSMSAPHVAGAAILLAALHPDWTPGQIKSALMTTASTAVVEEDLVTPADPLDMGAGRVDLRAAPYAALTFDETAERFSRLANDRRGAVHLNLPSVNAPVMPGRLTTTRVATNVSGLRQRFTTAAESDAGTVTVLPRRFTLDPNESATITVTIELPPQQVPAGTSVFGAVRITPSRSGPLHLPVAFVPSQGGVHLSQSCSPAAIPQGGTSECVVVARNDDVADTVVDLRTAVDDPLRITAATGAALLDGRRASLTDVRLAGARPGRPSVDPGELFGYVPLDSIPGTAPPIPIGDEEILNISISGGAFVFAGQQWTTVGVDSNGYLVVGGGTAQDNNCCDLPDGPDPARPNNVLAPFWTDLDGTGAPGLLIDILGDGTGAWLVVEHRVHVVGTTDLRVFQTWIGLNGVEDITYAYAGRQAAPRGLDLLVGAENVLGEGDMVDDPPTGDLRVRSTDPVPGDSVSYEVAVRGRRPAVGTVTTTLDADHHPGTTIVSTPIRVLAGPPDEPVERP